MTDITDYVALALLLGAVAVSISMLGKAERIATALELLAAARHPGRATGGSNSQSPPGTGWKEAREQD